MEYRQATDGKGSNDLKSLEKGRGLMAAKRIEACSMAVEQPHFFFSGIVRAAMKKKVRLGHLSFFILLYVSQL